MNPSPATDVNARFYGLDLTQASIDFGRELAQRVVDKFPQARSIGVLAGLGGNGADGMAAALAMKDLGLSVVVYIVGRPQQFASAAATELFGQLQSAGVPYRLDCFAKEISRHDLFLEALVGTGLTGNLHKRCRDVIKRTVHFNSPILAVDTAVAGYTPKYIFSVNYPKQSVAEVIQTSCVEITRMPPGPGDLQAMLSPKAASYKSENGKLLVLTSQKHLESMQQILESCSFYLSDITFYTAEQSADVTSKLSVTDALLIGPGWPQDWIHTAAIKYLLDKAVELQVVWHPDSLASWAQLAENNLSNLVFGYATSQQLAIISNLKSLVKNCHHTFLVRGLQDTLLSADSTATLDTKVFPVQCDDLDLIVLLAAVLATRNPLPLAATAASFWGQVIQKLSLSTESEEAKVVKLAWDTCQDF